MSFSKNKNNFNFILAFPTNLIISREKNIVGKQSKFDIYYWLEKNWAVILALVQNSAENLWTKVERKTAASS